MHQPFRLLPLLFVSTFLLPTIGWTAGGPNTVPVNPTNEFVVVDVQAILAALPTGDRWLEHLEKDLLRFWNLPSALGEPLGNFPTYRCNNGTLVDLDNLCPELQLDDAIVNLARDYTRAKSRQIFAYGIAFHLTGKEEYLSYAIAGADWLIANVVDRHGAASWIENGRAGPSNRQRTSQDMAYAISGLAFLYYLTRDADYLNQVIYLKQHIFSTYYEPQWDLLRWVLENNSDGDSPTQKELVAQLDQIYGYLLWTTMALPEGARKKRWLADLEHLAIAMREQFFADTYGLYWGAITQTQSRNLANFAGQENPHTDFGHSIKTLWLTYRIGLLTGNTALVNFARPNMYRILERAYIAETGSWARGFKALDDGSGRWVLDNTKEWWSLAELDQTSATLALIDPVFARVLPNTYDYWFRHMVDHKYGGIWHMVDGDSHQPVLKWPKQHSWKNAFHSFEHALIGYLTTQQLHQKPVKLYYALADEATPENLQPYLFHAEVIRKTSYRKRFKQKTLRKYQPTLVSFINLR